jgi:predicted ribosome quality control (RQC) complex YloA/Tae2 family protein
MGSKGRPYRTFTIDGFEVLVGRGDEENDVLTLEVAAPADFWLHVAGGVPGSHVVVRNPEHLPELPAPVVEQAAALAAWHSKARDQRHATVHLSRVSEVRKRRGAPAGEVVLERWTTVRVSRSPDSRRTK